MTSTMPEPQMPVTPSRRTTLSKPGSSDQRGDPMTRNRGSSVSRSIRTRSIAPGAARWPPLICAPSNAGPVGLEAASSRSLVAEHDLGVRADVDGQAHDLRRWGCSARITPAVSAPTCPAMHGRT